MMEEDIRKSLALPVRDIVAGMASAMIYIEKVILGKQKAKKDMDTQRLSLEKEKFLFSKIEVLLGAGSTASESDRSISQRAMRKIDLKSIMEKVTVT